MPHQPWYAGSFLLLTRNLLGTMTLLCSSLASRVDVPQVAIETERNCYLAVMLFKSG